MRLVYGLAGLLAAAALFLFPVMGLTHSSGAVPGFTGGPADSGTCQVCHASYEVNEGTGSVSVAAPSVYTPGTTYELTVTVDNTTEPVGDDPVQGFQLSVQDVDGNHVGELVLTDEAHTRFSGTSDLYVTQTTAGRLESTWSMEWIAPPEAEAPEVVTIYVTGNAADGNGSPAGDYIYSTTAAMARAGTSAEPLAVPGAFALHSIFPNPLRSGGTARVALERPLPVTLTVYDGLGRAVHTSELGVLGKGYQDLPLGSPDLAPGIYFLEVSTPEGTLVGPFMVVR